MTLPRLRCTVGARGTRRDGRHGATLAALVSIRDTKALGIRAYPDPASPVRKILDSLPDEIPAAEFEPFLRALLAVSDPP